MAPGGGCLAGLPGDSTHQPLGFWKRDRAWPVIMEISIVAGPCLRHLPYMAYRFRCAMRERFFHRLMVFGLIAGLTLLAAWELLAISGLTISRKTEPTSSGRIVSAKPASSSHAEKLYTVKGRVMAVSATSLRIQYIADSISKEMVLVTTGPVKKVKPGDDVRVWYAMDGAGPVVKGVITMNEMLDPKGERSATSKDLR
jgi:hypothetical protein